MASNQKNSKLNKLLSEWKDGVVYASPWLSENGYTFLFHQEFIDAVEGAY